MGYVDIIAQILGLFISIISVGVLINTAIYRRMVEEFTESPALCHLGGLLSLFFGLFILIFHNTWEKDWTTIITIFGWLSVIKGTLLIAYPKSVSQLSWIPHSDKVLRYVGVMYLLLGLFLTVKGFSLF